MTEQPRIEIFTEDRIDASLDEQIRGLLTSCFPHRKDEYARSRILGGNVPVFTVVLMQDKPVGHLAAVDRTITAGAEDIRVAGIANVCIEAGFRGRQLGGRMLDAAMMRAKGLGFDFGMLFCQEHVVNVYRRAGWLDIPPAPITYSDGGAQRQIPPDRYRMYYPLNRTNWPAGPIDLHSSRW